MDNGRRRLVATLACRNNGTRLYGKPMQRLGGDTTILEQIIAALNTFEMIDDICLCIADGPANHVFRSVAEKHDISWIFGSPTDVLERLIQGAHATEATDVFRVTTECPFFDYSELRPAWEQHLATGADITVLDVAPEGTAFEIYSVSSLERSHEEGLDPHCREHCSPYARVNQHLFQINIRRPREDLQRLDLRVTVDNPEDLILCRAVYERFQAKTPLVPLEDIVRFLDQRADLRELVAPYVVPEPLWVTDYRAPKGRETPA